MSSKRNKKHIVGAFFILVMMFILMQSNQIYAASKVYVGSSMEGELDSYDDKDYTLIVKHKTKIQINITTWSDDDYTEEDDYIEDDVLYLSLLGYDYYDDTKELQVGRDDSDKLTVTLEKGSYTISLLCFEDNVAYEINVNDVSSYTTKISMASNMSLVEGSSKTLSVKSKERGCLINDITWSTSNEEIATVNSSGKVTGVKAGTCIISAKTNESNTVKCKVKITALYASKISTSKEISIYVRNSKTLPLRIEEGGKKINTITWSSSNNKVAIVSKSGKITGVKAGNCIISGKMKDGNTIKCKVIVKARPQLYIKEASFGINYVGGIEPYITLENNFGKTIKYIYFNIYFYNTVGDPAYCSIQNTNYQCLRITGPIKDGIMDTYYWDAVIYNYSTGKMYIKSARVEFMDGTSKTISIKKSYK